MPSATQEKEPPFSLSIIVPCWNDATRVRELVRRLEEFIVPMPQIIVALPAESANDTRILDGLPVEIAWSARIGRGDQLNAGAARATGKVLLFHHADSRLTAAHLDGLRFAMADPTVVGGAFHRAFDDRHPGLRWLEPLARLHCRWRGTLYGDQSVFVRRSHFEAIGRYRDFPLMEDVEFSDRLRKSGRIAVIDPPMVSSPRRHRQNGRWRTTIQNAAIHLLYRAGMSTDRLHRIYYARNPATGHDSASPPG